MTETPQEERDRLTKLRKEEKDIKNALEWFNVRCPKREKLEKRLIEVKTSIFHITTPP